MAAKHLLFALALVTAAAAAEEQRQPPNANKKESRLSQRQSDRIAQQKRLIDCNRQARDKHLRGALRQEFTRECIGKGDDNAAVGGGQPK